MNKFGLILSVAAGVLFYFLMKPPLSKLPENHSEVSAVLPGLPEVERPPSIVRAKPSTPVLAFTPPQARQVAEIPKQEKFTRKDVISYVLDEGVVVVQGDLVVGSPVDENPEMTGLVVMPKLDTWKTSVIAFYIQPNVQNPERIYQALEMFNGTAVQFVPYTDQEDVLVFEDSTGICKSYVGRVGGKQPIWIPPGCGATEVAHEIMHALGFVHEQNRTDRDQYIRVIEDNIKPDFKDNFEKLPNELMSLSALDSFDFESIMIYPPDMFANSHQPTMVPAIPGQEIRPGFSLSDKDRSRINRAFGAL